MLCYRASGTFILQGFEMAKCYTYIIQMSAILHKGKA